MNELAQYAIDDLVDELGRRCGGVLVATLKALKNGTEARQIWYRGGFAQAVGLATIAERFLLEHHEYVPDEDNDFDAQWAEGV